MKIVKLNLLSKNLTYFIDMLPLTTNILVIEQEIFLLQYFLVLQNQSDADTKYKQVCQRSQLSHVIEFQSLQFIMGPNLYEFAIKFDKICTIFLTFDVFQLCPGSFENKTEKAFSPIGCAINDKL